MDPNGIIGKDQCGKVLERYTGCKNFVIQSYSVKSLDSQLDGMIGQQYFLEIIYQADNEESTAQFFLKSLSSSNPVMFEISKSICAFEKESFYYDTLVPLLKSKGFNVDFVATSYLNEAYVTVLEDLSLRSFKNNLKNKPLDLQHSKKSLEVLAKFHAQPLMYELLKSKDLDKNYSVYEEFRDVLEDKVFCSKETAATRYITNSVKGLFLLIDEISENGVDKAEFKNALQAVLDEILSSEDNPDGFRSTTLHGDLWANNFLYRYDDRSEITDCILIDFQTLNYGPPAMDVLQFIFTNTRRSFRDQHIDELLSHYYKYFSDLLAERGFQAAEILSESEFQESCRACSLPAKIISTVDRGITFTSDKDYADASKDEETFSKYLFEERGKYIIKGFKENEQFRELMTEDIVELRDMLFNR